MLGLLGDGLVTVAQWNYLVPLFFGTLAGVVGGALPGVTITTYAVFNSYLLVLLPRGTLTGW